MNWALTCQVFPPCFQQSHYLQKQWWHQVIWLVSLVISVSSLCSVLALSLMILKKTVGIDLSVLSWVLSYSFKLTFSPLLPFLSASGQSPTLFGQKLAQYLQTPPLEGVDSQLLGLWILLGYSLSLIFLPSFIYHLCLSFLLGERWRRRLR